MKNPKTKDSTPVTDCKSWRVLAGMVSTCGGVVRSVDTVGGVLWWWDGFGQASLATALVPDLSAPATQGCVLELISRNNLRRSKSDALRDLAHAMGRGLSIEEALVYELERCTEAWDNRALDDAGDS